MHDLNNVFQVLLHASEAIAAGARHSDMARLITRTVEQGQRILSSQVSGNPVSLAYVVESAAQFVQDFASMQDGPTLNFIVEVDPALTLRTRPGALGRALVNLFVNVSEAARRGERPSAEIRIAARRDDSGIVLTVEDDGPGIPETLLRFIFIPRFSANEKGEGLGLNVVQSAVRDCGGTIAANNRPSGGAVFTIRLAPCAIENTGTSSGSTMAQIASTPD